MSIGIINIGTGDDTGDGDPIRSTGRKLNLAGVVLDRVVDAPAITPALGNLYIVPVGATGDFAGQDNALAFYNGAAWEFYAPAEGWRVWDANATEMVVFTGGAWDNTAIGAVPSLLGLTDTPGAYGTAGQALIVNPGVDGLIFGDVSGGGGGGSGDPINDMIQEVDLGTFDLSVDTLDAGNEIDIDVSGVDWVEIESHDCAVGVSGTLAARVGVTTVDSGASDYNTWVSGDTFGNESILQNFMRLSADGTSELGGRATIRGLNDASIKTTNRFNGISLNSNWQGVDTREALQADDTLQIFSRNGDAFTGGTVRVIGYKRTTVSTSLTVTPAAPTPIPHGGKTVEVVAWPDYTVDLDIDLTDCDEVEIVVNNWRASHATTVEAILAPISGTFETLYGQGRADGGSVEAVNETETGIVLAAFGNSGVTQEGVMVVKHFKQPDTPTYGHTHLFTGNYNRDATTRSLVNDVHTTLRLAAQPNNTPTSGSIYVRKISYQTGATGAFAPAAYDFRLTFAAAPTASEVLERVVVPRSITFPANMEGSVGQVGTNPTATFDIDVQDDGVSIGTISVSTGGVFTFTTTSGTPKHVAAGSVVQFIAPVGVDATIADLDVGVMAETIGGLVAQPSQREEITGTAYDFVAADAGKWKWTSNGAAVTLTVDASLFNPGDEVMVDQAGAGLVSFAAEVGTTINSRGALTDSAGQYAVMGFKVLSASEVRLFGDIA